MRFALCLLFLFVGFAGMAEAAWIPVHSATANQVPDVAVRSAAPGVWQIDMRIPGFTMESFTLEGQTYEHLSLPNEQMAGADGEAELPVISRLMALRSLGDPELEIVSEEWMELEGSYELASGAEDGHAQELASIYAARDEYLPEASFEVTPRQIMGGVPLAVVQVHAAKYNPFQKKIRVLKSVELRLHETGSPVTHERPITETTASILRAIVPNWDEISVDVEVVRGTLLYIFRSTELLDNIQSLATWRARKGFTVELCDPAQITWTTAGIKSYIQNRYNLADPPLEFVCLLGDHDGTYAVPAWSQSGGVGDFNYSRLDGTDLLPDVHIGRCCFDTETELNVIVTKILGYERNPARPTGGTNPSWFKGGGLFCGSGSGISCVYVMRWIRERMLDIGYTSSSIDTVYYIHESVTGAKMVSSINSGISLYAYRGYLYMEDFDQEEINALNNYGRLPFMVTITCGTNDFNTDNAYSSICEFLLKAGSTSNPTGVIGAVGTSSMATHTRFNNCLVGGVFQGLLREGNYTMGGSVSRSKVELRLNYPADSSYVHDFCHYESLIGDPAVDVYTDTPETLFVNNPGAVPVGTNTLTLTVTNGSAQAVEGAYLNLMKGTEVFTGDWTDANGQVVLNFETTTVETLFVTATKHNCRPALNYTLVQTNTRYVSPGPSAFVIDDDNNGESQGDGNGMANPEETIELRVPLKNWGTSTAYGVSAEISLSDPFVVSIADNYETYGDIAPGAEVWSSDDFGFTIASYAPDGYVLQFALEVSDATNTWLSAAPVTISNGNFEYKGCIVSGAGGNGVLDPGETGQLQLKLNNIGTRGTSLGTIGYLRSGNLRVTVTDSVGAFGASLPGGQSDNSSNLFAVSASSLALPGERIPFTCIFPLSHGFADTVPFNLFLGSVASNTPTPADSYGYWAFDNTDLAYGKHPTYNWVEIDPRYGGSGTSLNIVDASDEADMTVVANLPFTFRYYGQDFNQISVCSNGWLAMGANQVVHTEFRNHTIPSALGPSYMIAPFWDDLRVTGSFDANGPEKEGEDPWAAGNNSAPGRHLDDCVPDFQITVDCNGYTSPVRTTCGAGNDCATRDQEDHIYEVQITDDGTYTITLCNSPGGPQAWDSFIYLDAECCGATHIASNDDGCGAGGLSRIQNVHLSPGTYYLLIEGYYPDNCGEYQLDITCYQPPGVYAYHDAANHRFIIEWSRVYKYNGGTNPEETFECILYQPGYPATPTGDGEILFQYYACTNTYDVYSSNDYATVGIENGTETDGVLYSYWNMTHPNIPGAASMGSGRAILFTTQKLPSMTPRSPTNLTAIRSSNDIQLRWNAVRQDTLGNPIVVSGYKIYRDTSPFFAPGGGNYLGTAADTSCLDVGAASGSMYFYVVQAYVSGSLFTGNISSEYNSPMIHTESYNRIKTRD
ncbi:MAG: C25 family cysteine peptidase [bacterium]